MPCRDVSTPPGEQCLPCLPRRTTPRLLGLSAMMTIFGVLTVAGCYISRTIDQATASDVNNRNFTFANGAVFHAALANVSAALVFSNNAQNFTLCSGSNTASGTNRFGSCTLTVTDSTYSSGAGPQIGDVIKLDPCDFDSDNTTLTVSNRDITATSAVATTLTGTGCSTATQTTTSAVNNQSFTFANGEVFHTSLINVQTALAFSNNAQNFTLTSAGTISGTATGTSSVAGSCILTVTTSTYSAGPQRNDIITLNPCTYNSSDNTLTVTNLGLTVTSAPGQVR
jgi:hypothetical protein